MRLTALQALLLTLVLSYLFAAAADANPISDLPPIIMDETANVKTAPNTHTTIFNPVGKYATDVQYQLVRIPIHFAPIKKKKAQEEISIFVNNVKNLVKTRATEIPITQILELANHTLGTIKYRTKIFGITATAFGISNSIQISKLNAQMATLKCTH